MKKNFLIGLVILLSACQSAVSESSITPEATATHIVPITAPVLSPQVATVTQTNTPFPTPSLTLVPPARFFTEGFDAPLSHWSTLFASGDSSHVDILNENSTLTFELYSTNTWVYAIYGAFEYESVHLDTRVESHGNDINAVGLVCHYDEQEGWYEFNISSDGTYNVLYGQWLAENIARYTPILNDASEHIETGSSANEIGLDCYEDILQFYINGKLIRKLNVGHIGLTGGKVGVALASFNEAPVKLAFDWVKVSEP